MVLKNASEVLDTLTTSDPPKWEDYWREELLEYTARINECPWFRYMKDEGRHRRVCRLGLE